MTSDADRILRDVTAGRFSDAQLKQPVSLRLLLANAAELSAAMKGALKARDDRIADLEKRLAALEGKGLSFEGTHQRGCEYRRGHTVVCRGSLWIATTTTTKTPGESSDWALAAKAGRDARR